MLWAAGAQAQPDGPLVRVRVGDDVRWAHPTWDDADWERRPLNAPADTAAVLWVRLRVRVGQVEALGVEVSAVAAREVYWDGVLVGQSGRVGLDWAGETPGPIDAVFPVPDSLAAPGVHVVAVRMSTFRRPPSVKAYVQSVHAGDLRTLAAGPLRAIGVPLVFLGGFVLAGLYYGALFAADRRRTPLLLTSLLSLSVALLLVAEAWRPVVGYDYDAHLARLWTVTGLTCAIGFLLTAVCVVQFAVPRGRAVLALVAVGAALAIAAPVGYDAKAFIVFAVSLVASLSMTAWAAVRRKSRAGLAVTGVALAFGTLVATGFRFLDGAFFVAFAVLLAGLLGSLGLQTRDERRQYEASRAVAARLEAELLKKHLQPHFLMNTLTTVMEWVETDPPTGARALQALADELRALSDVSGERLIPLARELALCRAHLGVMGFRRDVRFELDADGVDPTGAVPPAVLHTLVENAATHNAYAPGDVRLTLRETRDAGRRRYTLRVPLAGPPREGARDGTGLRYVRARLEESYPGDWALSSQAEGGEWVSHVDLPLADWLLSERSARSPAP